MAVVFSFLKVLLSGRSSMRLILGITSSFAFSITVILCAIGLMDGFERTLKQALKVSTGDMNIYFKQGFFNVTDEMAQVFRGQNVEFSPFIKTEGFLVQEGLSKGVLIKAVDQTFSKISNLGIALSEREMAIGKELARAGGLKVGDEVALALATGQRQLSSLPSLYPFEIKQIVDHKIYDKNMRFTYISLGHLQSILGLGQRVNLIALNKFEKNTPQLIEKITALKKELTGLLDPLAVIRPFWQEFGPLLEAVKIEKFIMIVILQLVIVIATFNIVAFISFLNEKKAKDIFLFQALGISKKGVIRGQLILLTVIWAISCLKAMGMFWAFKWAMANLSFLELPGEIYNLARIDVALSPTSTLAVFALAFLWTMVVSWPGLKRQKKSLIEGLRLEFNR